MFGDTQADLFYCGPGDQSEWEKVEGLIKDVGLRPIRVGNHDMSPVVDDMTRLWAALAMGQGRGSHLAFKMLE